MSVARTPPRYVWRELCGYPLKAGSYRQTSDFMILDSFYNYAVVYYDKASLGRSLPYVDRRLEVERICALYNAQDVAEQAA